MKFTDLTLSEPTLKAIKELGYSEPTPIQQQSIPAVLSGKDVLAAAQTGTGKTASFVLPIIEGLRSKEPIRRNHIRTLILAPTRELALQIAESVKQYGQYHNLRSLAVYGGVKINPQMMKLRGGVDILIATPGRLLDLYGQNAVKFFKVDTLVLDEADRMLDMGFIHDIRKIIQLLPNKRQNLMFSATFSKPIRELAKTIVHDPIEIQISTENSTAKKVQQVIHPVDKKRKNALLLSLITKNRWQQALVFTRTKHGANRLTNYLDSYGIKSLAIHGNKSQGARVKALSQFKSGEIDILVATDIAARGLDIDLLPYVVNFDLPSVPEDYVHRIGRTGRAGAQGQAVSLVSADEIKQLVDIEKLIQKKLKRVMIDGFVPDHDLPTEYRVKKNPPKKAPNKPKRSAAPESRGSRRNRQRRPTAKA